MTFESRFYRALIPVIAVSACSGSSHVNAWPDAPPSSVVNVSGNEFAAAHKAMHFLGISDGELLNQRVIIVPENGGFRVGFVSSRGRPTLTPSLESASVEVFVAQDGQISRVGRGE